MFGCYLRSICFAETPREGEGLLKILISQLTLREGVSLQPLSWRLDSLLMASLTEALSKWGRLLPSPRWAGWDSLCLWGCDWLKGKLAEFPAKSFPATVPEGLRWNAGQECKWILAGPVLEEKVTSDPEKWPLGRRDERMALLPEGAEIWLPSLRLPEKSRIARSDGKQPLPGFMSKSWLLPRKTRPEKRWAPGFLFHRVKQPGMLTGCLCRRWLWGHTHSWHEKIEQDFGQRGGSCHWECRKSV